MPDPHAALNAALNLTATVLLVLGWRAIRTGRSERHARLMISALGVSVAFLASYVVRHYGADQISEFPKDLGWIRTLYFVVLATHVPLAALVPFMALRTVFLAWKERWDAHRRLARWTFPVWMYVSVTGVVVYGMLYHLAPALSDS